MKIIIGLFSVAAVFAAMAADAPWFWKKAKYAEITSPAAISVRAGSDFSYQVVYKAKEPYALELVGYAGRPLPEKVSFDAANGVLSGNIAAVGEYLVTIVMHDEKGGSVNWEDLRIKVEESRPQPKTLAGETIYQIQIQGFDREANFAGVRKHLKRLADLGITWIYLSPITAADRGADRTYWSNRQRKYNNPINPYRPADYYHVEPNYGTDEEFRELVAYAHSLGLKVMIDVVFFHSGPNAVFAKNHPEWFVRDKDGNPVRNEWMFPTLDIANPALRKYLKDSLVMWALDYGVDGYRTDCGCDIPLDFWEECAAVIDAKKRDVVWLLEGAKREYCTAYNIFYGFTCTINYLAWHMDGRLPASVIRKGWQEEVDRGTGGAYCFRGTDTHDVANNDGVNRQEKRWGHQRAEAAIALCFALDGPAWLFEGQEIGWSGPFCIFTCTHPDWDKPECLDRPALIKRLATMKKTEPAFGSRGRIAWMETANPDDEILFYRIAPDGKKFRCFFNLEQGIWEIEEVK